MKSGTKLLAVIAAAASIAACGGSGSSDEDAASKVVVDSNNKLAQCLKDGGCEESEFDDLLTGPAKTEIEGMTAGMAGSTMDIKIDTKVNKVTLDGDTGTVEACITSEILGATQNGEEVDPEMFGGGTATWSNSTFDVEKVDGKWKVSGSNETDGGEVVEGEESCPA